MYRVLSKFSFKHKINFYQVIIVVILMSCHGVGLALTKCANGSVISDQPILFFQHEIGSYNIQLASTLSAIKSGNANQKEPYFKKKFNTCPGLKNYGNACIEYTVYPNDNNFQPSDIMQTIKKYNNNNENRGSVRIITDTNAEQYVYTADHYATFCGPYKLS
jgi:hypothetical protein